MGKKLLLTDEEKRIKQNEYKKSWYAATREISLKWRREYTRRKSRQEHNEKRRTRRAEMRDKFNQRAREVHAANPEPQRLKAVKRKKKRDAYYDTFKKTLNDGHCSHAGCKVPWQACEIDHLIPAAKGKSLSACITVSSIDAEIRQNTLPDGTVALQLLCVNHHRMKTYKNENSYSVSGKQQMVQEWRKEQKHCQLCKITVDQLPLCCFDCDHINRALKVESVAVMAKDKRYTLEQVEEELAKCRMLCGTCHRCFTAKQMGYRWADALTLRPIPQ